MSMLFREIKLKPEQPFPDLMTGKQVKIMYTNMFVMLFEKSKCAILLKSREILVSLCLYRKPISMPVVLFSQMSIGRSEWSHLTQQHIEISTEEPISFILMKQ